MKLNPHSQLWAVVMAAAASALIAAAPALAQAPTAMASFQLTSVAFHDGANIPVEYTCDGAGNSAPLRWSGAPAGTRSFALVMFDPDARPPQGFVHWVAYDIPPAITEIPSGKNDAGKLPVGGTNGDNGARRTGFTPSCPPAGPPHHYQFTLYALSVPSLGLPDGASRDQLLEAMKGKILAQTQLIGLYAGSPNRPPRPRRGPARGNPNPPPAR